MRVTLATALALACTTPPPEDELRLDGPAHVVARELGTVPTPRVVGVSGDPVRELQVTSSDEEVVVVHEDGRVEAVGPGEATVRLRGHDQTLEVAMSVEVPLQLGFQAPPASLRPGETRQLEVWAKVGDHAVEPHPIRWVSSDPTRARVTGDGQVLGVAPGRVYITARRGHVGTMVEIEVVE